MVDTFQLAREVSTHAGFERWTPGFRLLDLEALLAARAAGHGELALRHVWRIEAVGQRASSRVAIRGDGIIIPRHDPFAAELTGTVLDLDDGASAGALLSTIGSRGGWTLSAVTSSSGTAYTTVCAGSGVAQDLTSLHFGRAVARAWLWSHRL